MESRQAGRRAAAARAGNPLLSDPLAIDAAGRLRYDFTNADRGAMWHAVRVATFDDAVRRFLKQHPDGTVAALGEGLETQFWRVDNGHVRWLTVDLPSTMDLRRQVLLSISCRRAHPGWCRWLCGLSAAFRPASATHCPWFPFFSCGSWTVRNGGRDTICRNYLPVYSRP